MSAATSAGETGPSNDREDPSGNVIVGMVGVAYVLLGKERVLARIILRA